ncbi:unnamed protein product [Symbiodinium sp. CCMP2592]|nr:unnamed protein product [Symbiodinium sp. CCMP2592]
MKIKKKNLKKARAQPRSCVATCRNGLSTWCQGGGKIVKDEQSPKASPKAHMLLIATTSNCCIVSAFRLLCQAAPAVPEKSSPKQSPKAAPAAEQTPAKKGKDKKAEKASPKAAPEHNPPKPGRAAPRPPPTPEEREKATKKAISLIKAGLAKNPEEQQRGAPYIIDNWHQDWKPILGPYRKFVASCACFRVEQGANSANYTIHLVDGADDGPRPFWIVSLNKAWQAYSLLKKEQASVDEFLAEAKAAAKEPVPGAAPGAPTGKKRKDDESSAKTKSAKKAKTKAKEE